VLDVVLANSAKLELKPNNDIRNRAASKNHEILLSGITLDEKGAIRDTLVITTDIPGEKTIKLPVHGFVKIPK